MAHTACSKKTEYERPEEAVQALRKRMRQERMRLYAYKCLFCHKYHLTKMKPPADTIVSLVSHTTKGNKSCSTKPHA